MREREGGVVREGPEVGGSCGGAEERASERGRERRVLVEPVADDCSGDEVDGMATSEVGVCG